MSNSWKIGPVQLELREDGTFSIYQPDANRVMTRETALNVGKTITDAYLTETERQADANATGASLARGIADVEAGRVSDTVGGGVISTSDGPAEPTPRKRGPGRPRKTG